VLHETPIPTDQSAAVMIAADAQNNLWFTEMSGNKIEQLTFTGGLTYLPLVFR
jgi:streptogramin lyase